MNYNNLATIARYEVKFLRRSWLFKIFGFLILLFITIFQLGNQSNINGFIDIDYVLLSASFPYINASFYNIGQSIVAIFLAANFLVRDKKLDTAEVVYVHPMSNADYIFGKTWGILRAFVSLNLITIAISVSLNLFVSDSPFDPLLYAFYLFTLTIPTLIYILGVSFVIMCVTKNQAITFLLALAYIGIVYFTLRDDYYGVFDFFSTNIPNFGSDAIGHPDIKIYLINRSIFLFIGLALLTYTVALVNRLPESPNRRKFIVALGTFWLICGGVSAYQYINHYKDIDTRRDLYRDIYNDFNSHNKLRILTNEITLKQDGSTIDVSSKMLIKNPTSINFDSLVLYLNPFLKIEEIKIDDQIVDFNRIEQVIVIPKSIASLDTLTATVKYNGGVDEQICYLDIDDKLTRNMKQSSFVPMCYGEKYAFLTDIYTLLTPESVWYPVTVPPVNPSSKYNVQKNFTKYTLKVENTRPDKSIISQGVRDSVDGYITYSNDILMFGISLTIGDYKRYSITSDSTEFSIYYFDGHDLFSKHLDQIKRDTLATVISSLRSRAEESRKSKYLYPKLAIVESPVSYISYQRTWKKNTENLQPEIVHLPEFGVGMYYDFKNRIKMAKLHNKSNKVDKDDKAIQFDVMQGYINYIFLGSSIDPYWGKYSINPMFADFTTYIYCEEYPVMDLVVNNMYNASASIGGGVTWWGDGLTNIQKANLYLQDSSLCRAMDDKSINSSVFYELVKQKSTYLRNYILTFIYDDYFNEFVVDFYNNNKFREVDFSYFAEEFQESLGVDLMAMLPEWYNTKSSPIFLVKGVDVNKVLVDDYTKYSCTLKVYNPTAAKGIVTISVISGGRGRGHGGSSNNPPRHYIIDSMDCKEIKIIVDDRPSRINVNTNISQNLPEVLRFSFAKVDGWTTDTLQGIFDSDVETFLDDGGEVIVDNEDEGFKIIDSGKRAKLKDFIKKEEESRYRTFQPYWGPAKWSFAVGTIFYGTYKNTCVFKRSGVGDNKVEWSTTIKKSGNYRIYTYVSREEYWGRHMNLKSLNHYYEIESSDGIEKLNIDFLVPKTTGWYSMGTYSYKEGDVSRVTLSDKGDRVVIADAIKWVYTESDDE